MGHQVPSQVEFDALKKRTDLLEQRVDALEEGETPPPEPVDCILSDWGPWSPVGSWSPCVGGLQSRTEERSKTVVVPPANGGAACGPSHETRVVTQACSPIPPGPPGMLQASDFTYIGRVRLGVSGWNMTGKTEGGQVSLLTVTASSDNGGKLYAMPYTVTPEPGWGNAPILNGTFQGWPTWNGETKLNVSWDYQTGALRDTTTTGNPWPFLGLAFYNGELYISYLDYYNTMHGATDHCLLVCDTTKVGDSRTKGPYRFVDHGSVKQIGGGLCATPHGLGMAGSMMCISRNMDNTWGPSLSMLPWGEIGTNPGGYQSPQLRVVQQLMHSQHARASRHGDYKPDLSNPYNPDGPQPAPGYMTGTWTQRDRMNAVAWIETTSGKRGYLTMGGMGTGQIWYGSYDAGPSGAYNKCKSADRGENAEGFRAEWRIYDPDKLRGGVVQPESVFSPYDRSEFPLFDTCERYYTGCYFDQASSTLFAASGAEVQVWAVA